MLGIIGGSGINLDLQDEKEVEIYTPFGAPSDKLLVGKLAGKDVVFLFRHGKDHTIPPHKINYRANIWALKSLGVDAIISLCAVGSLKEELAPKHFVLSDQFIDRTNGREQSFYTGPKVHHISMGEPICADLRAKLAKLAEDLGIKTHEQGTYVCVNGPRFSSKAESKLFRSWNCDVIGMTLVPECVLAREVEICYASVAMVTDYDCWRDTVVNYTAVVETMKDNIIDAKRLVTAAISGLELDPDCACRSALSE